MLQYMPLFLHPVKQEKAGEFFWWLSQANYKHKDWPMFHAAVWFVEF